MMNIMDMFMQGLFLPLVPILLIGLIPTIISIMLVLAIFEMNKNIRAIRMSIDKDYRNNEPDEAWIYEEKNKEPKEPKESIWNKKIF